ncbi:hypothetical protein M9H77_32783 [Catharanthus roseus]|uniref:Uncharacterized protein n=1 Tax=Catharanthus roseus TaxID=4058 RepID=A0ACC0A4U8_CATRO|nr:hypothetical protein M9H77_32783 [Catharanthus roseus]
MGLIMSILALICVLLCLNPLVISGNNSQKQSNLETYIVHLESPESEDRESLENWYKAFLPTATASSDEAYSSLVYSYHNIFKGFAAKLSPEQVKAMEKMPGFVSARPQEVFSLHTTHSPSFLGLQNLGFWKHSNYGKGVIIGVLDSGIYIDHPSFDDKGMPPPPAKWKGKCEFNTKAKCNNKIIGARVFGSDQYDSPTDQIGHGTHTSSTAAGNFFKGANVYGNANGTAVGVAPRAHLAMYKVCSSSCSEIDILAAMDAAIDDGVDIISFSLGRSSRPFYYDSFAIGAYSAMRKGIFVSCSAGNLGPFTSSLSNEAPWVLTVGASTIDRKIRATAVLGNNQEFDGESLYQPKDFPPTRSLLFYPGSNTSSDDSIFCSSELIKNTKVQGKTIVCVNGGGVPRIEKGKNVKAAGGVGMILINQEHHGYITSADAHVLPAAHLSYTDGLKVLAYINSTTSPMASILFKGTIIGDNRAPIVAGFSSRGPSAASPGILKPDVIGPGVNILAAWHLSVENKTNTKSNFNIVSGTSMSCPHLSGVAALLKSVHPHWSPAAIKSAMMTTADVLNHAKNPVEDQSLLPADAFATGSGHVNPAKASNPGLIYDIKLDDYIPYLCGLNYTNQQVSSVVQRKVKCGHSIAEAQLNYPSFSITFGAKIQRYTRTLTNVGEANSSYTLKVVPPLGVHVNVKPQTLKFSNVNQKLAYDVTFRRAGKTPKNDVSQGYLAWTSAKYTVRSPIVAIMGALYRP